MPATISSQARHGGVTFRMSIEVRRRPEPADSQNEGTELLIAIALTAVTGLSAHALYPLRTGEKPQVATRAVSRGTIVGRVAASGTLEAVTTVQVGSQISGTVQALFADFNSIVKRGQVIARLDPSLLQADLEQSKATLVRMEADVEGLAVALADAKTKEDRARELAARELIPRTDLETAEVAVRSADAQLRAARAQVNQAKAALAQAEVNLAKTVITSPIDGIVTARDVDVGQTVAASLQAPTLFVIAADLSQMQVKASVDESDLGSVREGQPVSFTVDAYPEDTFHGVVKQIRLNPVIDQNVVTYAAIISAPNPELKLRPGMTANVTVEVLRRENACAFRMRHCGSSLVTICWRRWDRGRPACQSVHRSQRILEAAPTSRRAVTSVRCGSTTVSFTGCPSWSARVMERSPRSGCRRTRRATKTWPRTRKSRSG